MYSREKKFIDKRVLSALLPNWKRVQALPLRFHLLPVESQTSVGSNMEW